VSNTVYLIRLRLLVWNTAQGWAEKRAAWIELKTTTLLVEWRWQNVKSSDYDAL